MIRKFATRPKCSGSDRIRIHTVFLILWFFIMLWLGVNLYTHIVRPSCNICALPVFRWSFSIHKVSKSYDRKVRYSHEFINFKAKDRSNQTLGIRTNWSPMTNVDSYCKIVLGLLLLLFIFYYNYLKGVGGSSLELGELEQLTINNDNDLNYDQITAPKVNFLPLYKFL